MNGNLVLYIEFAKKSFQTLLVYRLGMFFRLGGFFVSLLVLYYLWKAIFATSSIIEGYTFNMMLTYLVLSFAINALYDLPQEHILANKIIKGDVAMDLVKPIDLQGMFFAQSVGTSCNQLITYNIAFILISLFLFKIELPASLLKFSLFIISLLLGFIIMTAIGFICAIICFWTKDMWGVFFIKTALVLFFSGSFIPLHFLPKWLENLSMALPFHGIVYSPISIYFGTFSPFKELLVFFSQILWSFYLILLGRIICYCGLRKIIIQGG